MQPRFVLGGAVLLGALGFLMISSLRAGTMQSVPVAELRAKDQKSDSFVGKRLRIVGFVGDAPVRKSPKITEQGTISVAKFQVVEGAVKCDVSYSDALPDSFRVGGPVQIDGVYKSPGVIEADHVLTKCPSKYEEGEKNGKKPAKSASGA